jgi:hypothetical protein
MQSLILGHGLRQALSVSCNLMRHIHLLYLFCLLLSCKSKSTNENARKSENTFLNGIKAECHGARVLFFDDFEHSKESLLARDFKNSKSLNTLFTFIGDIRKDTVCYVFANKNPAGEIYFYKDSLMSIELLDLYFVLEGNCPGFYAGIDRDSPKFEFTAIGGQSLEGYKKELEKAFKK